VTGPFDWLEAWAAQRAAAGLRRTVRPRGSDGDGLLDLAGNDYLGLARHPDVVAAAARGAREWGAGSTGSRLVTGSTALHAELEQELAGHVGAEAALVFSSGYLANIGALTPLTGRGTLVVSDAQNHASIVDACRLSRARIVVVPHRGVPAVERALAERAESRALVVTDAVFSVDGDLAPLADLAAVARRHDAGLVVDEAHAVGVVGLGGRGAVFAAGLGGAADVVVTATLSKALGSQGGAVVGSRAVIDHIIDTGRAFIFDTGLAPACAGAALAALRLLRTEPGLAAAARTRASELATAARDTGLAVTEPRGAVCSVLLGSPAAAVAGARICAEHGVRVGCFRPPSVPDGVSRLRLTARADLADSDVERAARALRAVARAGIGAGASVGAGACVGAARAPVP
jgi:8-amino-7-oxononanoate synthase